MTGVSERSVASSRLAQRSAMPAVAGGAAGSVGTTSQCARSKRLLQLRRQFHAGGNGMFEPEGDQPLGEAERDQPLRRGARHLQHLRDLVLGVAGNEIEPAGARRVVETGFFILGRPSDAPSLPNPEVRHAFKDPIGAGGAQYGASIARLVMAAADKSPDRHAGRLGRRDAADAVLDHQRARRAQPAFSRPRKERDRAPACRARPSADV